MDKIQGKDVLLALKKMRTPATVDDILKLLPNFKKNNLEFTGKVKSILKAAIEFGLVKKMDGNKYQAADLEDSDDDSDEMGAMDRPEDCGRKRRRSRSRRRGCRSRSRRRRCARRPKGFACWNFDV